MKQYKHSHSGDLVHAVQALTCVNRTDNRTVEFGMSDGTTQAIPSNVVGPKVGDWLVFNENAAEGEGKLAWWANDSFNAEMTEYAPTDDAPSGEGLSFSDALAALKAGAKVSFNGWPDGVYLQVVRGNKLTFGDGTVKAFPDALYLQTADMIAVYVPPPAELLSDDGWLTLGEAQLSLPPPVAEIPVRGRTRPKVSAPINTPPPYVPPVSGDPTEPGAPTESVGPTQPPEQTPSPSATPSPTATAAP